jgi:hypothetical protein
VCSSTPPCLRHSRFQVVRTETALPRTRVSMIVILPVHEISFRRTEVVTGYHCQLAMGDRQFPTPELLSQR